MPRAGSPTTSESGYTDEEFAFLKTVQAYQKRTRRKFLTHVELLRIAKGMGYSLSPPTPITTVSSSGTHR